MRHAWWRTAAMSRTTESADTLGPFDTQVMDLFSVATRHGMAIASAFMQKRD